LMEAAKPKKAKTVKGVKKHLKNVSAKKGVFIRVWGPDNRK